MTTWDDQGYKRCLLSWFRLESIKTILLKIGGNVTKNSINVVFSGHAYFHNIFHQFQASLLPRYEKEKTMWWKTWENVNNNYINTKRSDRLPKIFKMYAWFFIYSLDNLFKAKLASWKRMENLRDITIHEFLWNEHGLQHSSRAKLLTICIDL